MAAIPGLDADVYFGDAETPLPDWRSALLDDDSDEDDASPEQLAAVRGILGFDPAELWPEEVEEEEEVGEVGSKALDPVQLVIDAVRHHDRGHNLADLVDVRRELNAHLSRDQQDAAILQAMRRNLVVPSVYEGRMGNSPEQLAARMPPEKQRAEGFAYRESGYGYLSLRKGLSWGRLKSMGDICTKEWNEASHNRGQPGNAGQFGPGGGAATTGAQAKKKGKRRAAEVKPKPPMEKDAARKSVVQHLLAGAKMTPKLAKMIAAKVGSTVWNHLTPSVQYDLFAAWTIGKRIEHKVMLGFEKSKMLAEEVAKEKGMDPKKAAKVARILGYADLALAWTVNAPTTFAVTGSMGAAKAASWIPVASLAFAVGSGMTNPYAALRAAKTVIARHADAPAAEGKKSMPAAPQVGESYFATCERDEGGHCLPSGEQGAAKPDKKKRGKSSAPVIFNPAKAKETDALIRDLFDGDATADDMASLVGAPDDAKVIVTPENGRLKIVTKHPDFEDPSENFVYRNDRGELEVHLEYISIKKSAQSKGIGSDIFARQVEQCGEMGVAVITAHLAKQGGFNGYYTWPRLGFNQSIEYDGPNGVSRRMKNIVQEEFPGAKSVQDLMDTKRGRDWWKKYGEDLVFGRFELSRGSRSMRVFDAYMEERAGRAK